MDRAVLIGQGRRLDVAGALGTGGTMTSRPPSRGSETRAGSSIEPLDVVMRRHIETALAAANGRIEGPHGAARMLRINPHTLRARMRKLKVEWRQFRHAARER